MHSGEPESVTGQYLKHTLNYSFLGLGI